MANGGEVLLVGTKRPSSGSSPRSGGRLWHVFSAEPLAGWDADQLANDFSSIAKYRSIRRWSGWQLGEVAEKGRSAIRREMERMHRNFEGIVKMDKPPAAMIVVDVKYEDIAVAEARRCEIPVAALVDTNSDPTVVDYRYLPNDDAVKSIRIILEVLVEAISQDSLSVKRSKERADVSRHNCVCCPVVAEAPG